jgi:hypothetical protein
MGWADDFANLFGYQYSVCFARARDAMAAYLKTGHGGIVLPENICPQAVVDGCQFTEINQLTGLANYLPVQLYGYREEASGCKLEIDPLMTGYKNRPICPSTIISFGRHKSLCAGKGAMFMTNNHMMAQDMEPMGFWNEGWNRKFTQKWHEFDDWIEERFERIAKWDAELGDSLIRIPKEQVMPWRVMRRVPNGKRDQLVKELRSWGLPVGTNYPSLTGSNEWGDTVINFLIDDMPKSWSLIIGTIEEVVHG